MKNVTRAAINKEIKKMGFDAELVKGEGYFYFVGDSIKTDSESVYVYKINDMTFDRWIIEFKNNLIDNI